MDRDEMLREQLSGIMEPVYMTNINDIVEGYKDKYGLKGWTSHLASDISGTTDKKSKEYRAAIRQFQNDKKTGRPRYEGAKPKASTTEKYKSAGEKLPPVGQKVKSQYSVTVRGTQGSRQRTITASFSGSDAVNFAHNPSFWQVYYSRYGDADLADMFDNEDGDDDSISGIAVASVSVS